MKKSALILCGGKGTRLGALGKRSPKSLVKIQGKEILWYIIKVLKKNGFTKFILPLGYKGKQIKLFLKKNKYFNTDIETIETGTNTHIGKRLALVIDKIKSENFLLLNGDAIFNFNINQILKEHIKTKATITFMSTEISYQYGTVGVLKNKVVDFKRDLFYEVLKIRKKPSYKAYNYSGISIINTKIIKNLRNICMKAKNFETEIYPKLIKKKAVMKKIVGFWHSIDNLKDIDVLNRDEGKKKYIKKIRIENFK